VTVVDKEFVFVGSAVVDTSLVAVVDGVKVKALQNRTK